MKRTVVVLVVVFLAVSLSLQVNLQSANAQTANYTVEQVDHLVQVLSSGHLVVTDTIHTSGQLPSSFQIGFPFKYGSHLLNAMAYDSNNQALPVTLGVQMQDQGFYAASINLPAQPTSTFTIVFTFENDLLTTLSTPTIYTLDFPAYPSLPKTAGLCNVTLQPPQSAGNIKVDKPDGGVNSTYFSTNNLEAFSYAPATANFTVTYGYFHPVTVSTLERNLSVDFAGTVKSADTYTITSNSGININSILLNLPANATNVVAKDQFGRTLSTRTQQTSSNTIVYNVTLNIPMATNDLGIITMEYNLPSISTAQSHFTLSIDPYPYLNYYVNYESITLTLPEGATITAPTLNELGNAVTLSRDMFQESLTVHAYGISRANTPLAPDNTVHVSFDYSSLWVAFRPTSWVWAITFVSVFGVALYKRPRTKTQKPAPVHHEVSVPVAAAPERSDSVEELASACEEKTKLLSDLQALDTKVQKGKISRRRYKVQTKNIELRLNSLNQRITQLNQTMQNAGGRHADLAKQIEHADAQLKEVNIAIKNLETRRKIGEISIETYRKQLPELERRKEKAQSHFDELLGRLR
ncbi:MAG: hypothetical protein NWF04_07990 [Candidatus Bathyarchaeota archaeon]|nr:hypothetical protein [Candidatus Bathyarchaeota archaeon]